MEKIYIRKLIPILLLSIGICGLYLLNYTNWFELHKIQMVSNLTLYLIFTSIIISSIYFFIEVWIYDPSIFIESEDSLEEKHKVVEALSKYFHLKKSEKAYTQYQLYSLQNSFGINQKITIEYDDEMYSISIKFSFINFQSNNKLLNKIEKKLAELMEKKASL